LGGYTKICVAFYLLIPRCTQEVFVPVQKATGKCKEKKTLVPCCCTKAESRHAQGKDLLSAHSKNKRFLHLKSQHGKLQRRHKKNSEKTFMRKINPYF